MNKNIVTGIDIGGTHITAALIDLEAHSIIRDSLIRRHVNSKGTSEQIVKEWTDAIAACKAYNEEASNKIGIAMPGPFDYEKGISLIKGLDKYEALYKQNVKELLAEKLKIKATEIFMMNDASCFLKGEVFGGAASGCNNVAGVTLGTGLGSATFKDGTVYDGDLYYTPYKDSTAEEYLSTRWFVKRYEELTGFAAKNVKEIRDQIPANASASAIFKEFGDNLGEVLAAYIKKYGTETIVIGGNIIHAWELFINGAKAVLENHSLRVSVVKAKLGEEAALVGAGSLCL